MPVKPPLWITHAAFDLGRRDSARDRPEPPPHQTLRSKDRVLNPIPQPPQRGIPSPLLDCPPRALLARYGMVA